MFITNFCKRIILNISEVNRRKCTLHITSSTTISDYKKRVTCMLLKMTNRYWNTSVSLLTAKAPTNHVIPNMGTRIHTLRTPDLLVEYNKITHFYKFEK